jgi:membrane fusion protein (multidrug efflux system)
MKYALRACLMILVSLMAWGCSTRTSDDNSASSPDPVVSVQIARIVRQTLPVTFTADGVTDALDRETVVSPIDGTVVSLRVDVGASVNDGDTLMTVRTRASDAAIAGARRLLAQAATPQQHADAEKTMQIAEQSQQVVPIIATRHGVVVNRSVSAGQTVTTGGALAQLVDLSTLDFVANVPLADLSGVKIGQTCRLRFEALPDRIFAGRVAAVSAQSDMGNQTAPVRIALASHSPNRDPESLRRVGMMGTATFITSSHRDVLVVPKEALLRDDINDSYTIYTVSADSLARAVPVTVGVVTDSMAEVVAPSLHVGDMVIVKGNYEVSDSTRVAIEAGK